MALPTVKYNHASKINSDHFKAVAKFVDKAHSQESLVITWKVITLLVDQFEILIHRRTLGRVMTKLGLAWSALKPAKRTFAAHRKKAIRNFLISFDKYERVMSSGNSIH